MYADKKKEKKVCKQKKSACLLDTTRNSNSNVDVK